MVFRKYIKTITIDVFFWYNKYVLTKVKQIQGGRLHESFSFNDRNVK